MADMQVIEEGAAGVCGNTGHQNSTLPLGLMGKGLKYIRSTQMHMLGITSYWNGNVHVTPPPGPELVVYVQHRVDTLEQLQQCVLSPHSTDEDTVVCQSFKLFACTPITGGMSAPPTP